MNPSYWLLLAATAGQAPVPPAPTPGGVPLVLLLADFRIVEGAVERVGGEYHVRRGKDVEKYPEKQVLFAGDSRDAVQRYLAGRAAQPLAVPTSPAVAAFPTRVQPILMNLCATCHARPDHPGAFKLDRVRDGYASPEVSQRNAQVAVGFVDRTDPSASPLLAKTLTAHGGQKAPALRDRSHPAYRNLEQWAHSVAGPAGAPKPAAVPPPNAAAPPPPTDPYDPEPFNRAARSKR